MEKQEKYQYFWTEKSALTRAMVARSIYTGMSVWIFSVNMVAEIFASPDKINQNSRCAEYLLDGSDPSLY